jgi:hypothetical protein
MVLDNIQSTLEKILIVFRGKEKVQLSILNEQRDTKHDISLRAFWSARRETEHDLWGYGLGQESIDTKKGIEHLRGRKRNP